MKDGGDSSSRKRSPALAAEAPKGASATKAVSRGAQPALSGERSLASPSIDHLVQYVFVADEVAGLALSVSASQSAPQEPCDSCGAPIEGEPAGRGLYFWSRSGDVRIEEPGLCEDCASAIFATATRRWETEDEEG